MNVLGVINKFVGTANNQQRDAIVNVKTLGIEQKDLRFSSWIYNTASHHNILGWNHLGGQSYKLDLVNEHTFYIGDTLDIVDDNNDVQEGTVSSLPTSKQIVVNTGQLDPVRTYYLRRKIKTTVDGYTLSLIHI